MEFQTAYNFNVVSAHPEIGRIRLELLHRSLPHTFIMVLLNYWIVSNTIIRERPLYINQVASGGGGGRGEDLKCNYLHTRNYLWTAFAKRRYNFKHIRARSFLFTPRRRGDTSYGGNSLALNEVSGMFIVGALKGQAMR